MAQYIAKENKCATILSKDPTLSGYAETNKHCRIGSDSKYGRTYLDFDFSGMPSDAIITEATLFYNVLHQSETVDYSSEEVSLNIVTNAWHEGVTWDTKPLSTRVTTGLRALSGWRSKDVTDLVQYWFDGTYDKNGLCIGLGMYSDSSGESAIYSGHYFDIHNHYGDDKTLTPYIEINYIGQQMYKIAEPRVRELADQVRRISQTTDYMTVEEMVTKLTEYEFGDGLPAAEEGTF